MEFPKFQISKREKEIVQIFGLAYVFTLIVIGIVYYGFHVDTLNPSPVVDVKNWVSLVVALIIPTAIVIAIWRDSKYDQKELVVLLKILLINKLQYQTWLMI